jgi:hypothetical protein
VRRDLGPPACMQPIYMLIIVINVLILFINNDDISNQNVPNMLQNHHGFLFY